MDNWIKNLVIVGELYRIQLTDRYKYQSLINTDRKGMDFFLSHILARGRNDTLSNDYTSKILSILDKIIYNGDSFDPDKYIKEVIPLLNDPLTDLLINIDYRINKETLKSKIVSNLWRSILVSNENDLLLGNIGDIKILIALLREIQANAEFSNPFRWTVKKIEEKGPLWVFNFFNSWAYLGHKLIKLLLRDIYFYDETRSLFAVEQNNKYEDLLQPIDVWVMAVFKELPNAKELLISKIPNKIRHKIPEEELIFEYYVKSIKPICSEYILEYLSCYSLTPLNRAEINAGLWVIGNNANIILYNLIINHEYSTKDYKVRIY